MKNLRIHSILSRAGFVALTFTLTACTNGMMGAEDSITSGQNNTTGGFVDQGAATSTPTEILIVPESVVGKFKAYGAKLRDDSMTGSPPNMNTDPEKVGLVVDVEKPLVASLGQAVVTDLVSRVANETAIGDIPVTINLTSDVLGLNVGRRVTFKFRRMVANGKIKNALVIFPNRQVGNSATGAPILTRVTPLPVSARIVQFQGKEIYLVGGIGADGYGSSNVIRISPTGVVAPTPDTTSTWGQNMLYAGTERAMLLSPLAAGYILDRYKSEPNTACINSAAENCDPGGLGTAAFSTEELAAINTRSAIVTITYNTDQDPYVFAQQQTTFDSVLQEVRIILVTASGLVAKTYCATDYPQFEYRCNQTRKNFAWGAQVEMEWRSGNPYATTNSAGLNNTATTLILAAPVVGPPLGSYGNLVYTGSNPAIKVEPL
jgi:hypothetical protein